MLKSSKVISEVNLWYKVGGVKALKHLEAYGAMATNFLKSHNRLYKMLAPQGTEKP